MVEFTINLSVNKNDYTIMLISPVKAPLPSMKLDRKRATVKNVGRSIVVYISLYYSYFFLEHHKTAVVVSPN